MNLANEVSWEVFHWKQRQLMPLLRCPGHRLDTVAGWLVWLGAALYCGATGHTDGGVFWMLPLTRRREAVGAPV